MNIYKETADTIMSQMKTTVGLPVIWSWGASAYQYLTDKNLQEMDIEGIAGLKFRVNGKKHKGHVLVVLNVLDYYDVYIGNVRSGKIQVKDKISDLDFTEFASVIDSKVEM